MKIEFDDEFMYLLKDAVMVEFLKNDLQTILDTEKHYRHPDEIKYDKKLIKAYRRILDYYGVKDGQE
jgi:hypothetical protein